LLSRFFLRCASPLPLPQLRLDFRPDFGKNHLRPSSVEFKEGDVVGTKHLELTDIRSLIRQHRDILAERYGVRVVAVFGSYVRGEQTGQSDLDLLVEFIHPISLLEFIGAEIYLTEALGVKTDLVPKHDVRVELRESILSQAVAL
jgi:predicted nucleotidyltransferase